LHFLRACRGRCQFATLWIDAICINQRDMQERSSQVKEMGRLYSGAQCVYCWLGCENTSGFISLFESSLYDIFLDFSSPSGRAEDVGVQLQSLSEAEYWTRMLILQEFLLAKDIYFLAEHRMMPYRKLDALIEKRYGVKLPGGTVAETLPAMLFRHRFRTRGAAWE
jgi:hypothetical protein